MKRLSLEFGETSGFPGFLTVRRLQEIMIWLYKLASLQVRNVPLFWLGGTGRLLVTFSEVGSTLLNCTGHTYSDWLLTMTAAAWDGDPLRVDGMTLYCTNQSGDQWIESVHWMQYYHEPAEVWYSKTFERRKCALVTKFTSWRLSSSQRFKFIETKGPIIIGIDLNRVLYEFSICIGLNHCMHVH